MWKNSIELGKPTEETVHGEILSGNVWTEVFANKKSVKQSEFYQASLVGLKPELVFEIRSEEYDDHELVRHPAGDDGTIYHIIRTYDRGEITEITVSSYPGGVSNG